MRELKFRAWDKRKKRMHGVGQIDFRKDGTVRRINATNNPDDWNPLLADVPDEGDEFILMQFTGLLDKKGKRIYEGDIVINRYHSAMDRFFEERGVVEYNVNTALYMNGKYCLRMAGTDELEIIGNIYETPYLLTQQTND